MASGLFVFMPTRPLRPCANKSCSGRATHGRHCADHANQQRARTRAKDVRPSASARHYDRKWRKKRADYLRKNPFCKERGCGERATHVDHIVSLADGGADDESNYQGMCHSHHSSKTNRVDGGFGNPKGRGEVKVHDFP